MSSQRYIVELLGRDGRARRFHNPMYLTPEGLINAFPESDEDLYDSAEAAHKALQRLGLKQAAIVGTTLSALHITARYKRWAALSAQADATPVRRPLAENYEIFRAGGRAALRKDYSAEYTRRLLREFRAEGWALDLQRLPTD